MGRTPSTTHRWLFCRALHLTPSDKKFGSGARMFFLRPQGRKRRKRRKRPQRNRVSNKSPCCLYCLCCPCYPCYPFCPCSHLNRKVQFSLYITTKPRRRPTGLVVYVRCRLLQHAELLANLNEGLNATVKLLSSVACRYLNTDTSLTLWNYWVVETSYEYTLLLQLCCEVL